MILSDAQLAELVKRWFPVDQDIAFAICLAESGGNTLKHNQVNEDSRGLWQINVAPGANPQYASWNLFDPEWNARAAYEIWQSWNGWCAWSVYEEWCGIGHVGTYRDFLARARAALAEPPPPPPEPPVASFTATPSNRQATYPIWFADASQGEITTWHYDFKDGTSSSSRNVSHAFAHPGSYPVRLTVTGPGGSDTFSRTVTITPLEEPPPPPPPPKPISEVLIFGGVLLFAFYIVGVNYKKGLWAKPKMKKKLR